MGQRPNYRVVAKSKASGKYQDIAAFWIGEKGINGQLDRSVEKIVLSNGAVIKPDSCWFNLQENREEASAERQVDPQYEESGADDGSEEIPF
jgi:hypothetical protein